MPGEVWLRDKWSVEVGILGPCARDKKRSKGSRKYIPWDWRIKN